jgi:hypothetical protein
MVEFNETGALYHVPQNKVMDMGFSRSSISVTMKALEEQR